jgi:MFS superfamily sulfate permease-like transporter
MLGAGVLLPILPGHPSFACPLRALTGVPCPLCGLSTSVEATVRLHFGDALQANPFGLVLVLVAIALLVVRPRRLPLPMPLLYLVLAASWLFELHRFSIL